MRSLTAPLFSSLLAVLLSLPLVPAVQAADTASAATPPAATTGAPAPRIGYAELAKIANESARGKAIQAQLKEKQAKLQADLEKKKQQLDKQYKAIEAQMPKLTPKQREEKIKGFQLKVEAAQKSAKEAEQALFALQDDLATALFKEVITLAETYGKANGFTAIVAKKELLFLAEGLTAQDVTAALSAALDAAPAATAGK